MALDHVLLALLSTRPASGYDLKKRIDAELAPLVAADLAQIYPALARLRRAGMVSVRARESGRGPRSYRHRTTARGRRELDRWLDAAPQPPRIRDEAAARILLVRALRPGSLAPARRRYDVMLAGEIARLRSPLPEPAPGPGCAARDAAAARLEACRRWARAVRRPPATSS
jgi:PadR family transcriptional regulator AphA